MDTPDELAGTLWSILQMSYQRGPLSAFEIDKEFKIQFDVSPDLNKFNFRNLDCFLSNYPERFQPSGNRWLAVSLGTEAEAQQKAMMACSKNNKKSASRGRFASRGGPRPTSYGAAFNGPRPGRGGMNNGRTPAYSPAPSQQSSYPSNQNYNYHDDRNYAPSRNDFQNGFSRSVSRNEGFRSEAPSRADDGYRNEAPSRNDGYRSDATSRNDGYRSEAPSRSEFGYNSPAPQENQHLGQQGFDAPNNSNNYGGGSSGGSAFGRQEQHYNREDRNTSYDSYNSFASSGGNGYVSACEEDNNSFGGHQRNEPPPPSFGQTGRDNNFGSSNTRREPSPPRRTPPVQEHRSAFSPLPGLVGPPPGLEKTVYHGSVFDRHSPLKDMSNASRSDSVATITKEPKGPTISLLRDAMPHALEILRDKWPVAIEGAHLIDLLSDVEDLEAYCASFVDLRDVLVNKLVEKANQDKLRVYVQKKFKGSEEQSYLSFIPGHPRSDDLKEQMLVVYKMTCQVLKKHGSMSLKDLTARLGIENRGKYAPRSFVWNTLQEHKDVVKLTRSPDDTAAFTVSLLPGSEIPSWSPPKDESLRVDNEPPPPTFGSVASNAQDIIEQARLKMARTKIHSAEDAGRASSPRETHPPTHSQLLIDRNRRGEWIRNVRVCYFQDLTSFVIRTNEEFQAFSVLTGKLMELYSIRGCNKPTFDKGELVVVCVNGEYYRAVITEKNRRMYRVDRIDIGDYCCVDRADIYQLNEPEFKKPALATRCSVMPFEIVPQCETNFEDEEYNCGIELQRTPVDLRILGYKGEEVVVEIGLFKDNQSVVIPNYFHETEMIRSPQ